MSSSESLRIASLEVFDQKKGVRRLPHLKRIPSGSGASDIGAVLRGIGICTPFSLLGREEGLAVRLALAVPIIGMFRSGKLTGILSSGVPVSVTGFILMQIP